MATQLALELSRLSTEWEKVFHLQNNSQFKEALAAISNAPVTSVLQGELKQLLTIRLKLCHDMSSGHMPGHDIIEEIRERSQDAQASASVAILIESSFLLFDSNPALRDEALQTLEGLQQVMDAHTLRRFLHRKGLSFIATNRMKDAYDLWTPLIKAEPNTPEDHDDSLCTLLLDFGRLCTELGKYSDAVEIYNQALACAKTAYNQALALIRLSNALERMSRPAQADKRRMEYFNLIKREYPTHCASCSVVFGKEPKFLITCCKTIVHSECLRQVVSEIESDETNCPFCSTKFTISDVADPTSVEGRKYKKSRRVGNEAHAEDGLGAAVDG